MPLRRARSVLGSCLLLAGLLLPTLAVTTAAREALILRDGSRIEADSIIFDGQAFRQRDVPAAKPVPRNQASDWFLSADSKTTPAATAAAVPGASAAADPAILQELLRQRTEAQALAARFPGCKGVQVLDEGFYRLTADHRHLYRYHFVGLILNEDLLSWGSLAFGFTEGRSRVKVSTARCLTPDGRVLVLDPKEMSVTNAAARGDEFFDPNARQVTGNIPGVEVGALVEYLYEYDNYAPEDWRIFFPTFYFQGDLPVNHSVFHVEVPTGTKLLWWQENWTAGVPPKPWYHYVLPWHWRPAAKGFSLRQAVPDASTGTAVGKAAAYDAYTWEKHNIPPVVNEPSMPPWSEIAPAVYATIMDDWSHLNALIGGMQRERLKSTPEIQAKAAELTRGLDTPDAKAAALYHWVQKNIRYISIKSSLSSGWAGHPAAETLANGYGDCTDKSNLLAALLRTVGIDAEPVVLRTNDAGLFVPRHPMIHANHCITEVHMGDRDFYLDSTTQDHRYPALRSDDHGVVAYNFIGGWRREVPVPPGVEAHGKVAMDDMTLQPDGVLNVYSCNQYRGGYEAGLRGGWKQVPDALRRQLMQQYLNGFAPGARLEDFTMPDPQNLDTPFTLEYRYRLPAYVVPAGKLRVFQFPDREEHFPEIGLAQRRYAVNYTTSEATTRTVTLKIPAGWRVVELPPAVNINSRYVHYMESYSVTGGEIKAQFQFERKTRRVPVSDYAAYRKALSAIATATQRPLYLETAP